MEENSETDKQNLREFLKDELNIKWAENAILREEKRTGSPGWIILRACCT